MCLYSDNADMGPDDWPYSQNPIVIITHYFLSAKEVLFPAYSLIASYVLIDDSIRQC